jgi:hypothetical protein
MAIKIPYHLHPIETLTSEDLQQAALISWSESKEAMIKYPMLKWLFAVPNGGKRSGSTAATMQRTGLKKGVLDLLLLYPSHHYHGLAIELKYGRNKPSKEQQDFIWHHEPLGYRCVVCWSWLDAKREIINYLSEF